jgi:hypothetical protein
MTVKLELLSHTFIKAEFAMKGCCHAELVSASDLILPPSPKGEFAVIH